MGEKIVALVELHSYDTLFLHAYQLLVVQTLFSNVELKIVTETIFTWDNCEIHRSVENENSVSVKVGYRINLTASS